MNTKSLSVNYAGAFKQVSEKASTNRQYKLSELAVGVNFTDNHIIKLSQHNEVEWVVSRMCDHASGTLEPCKEKQFAQCPLHGWKLDLEKLKYSNVNVKKDTLSFNISSGNLIVDESETYLMLPDELLQQQNSQALNIRFLAHASLLFNCGEIKIITDPWLKGPCFFNGWWHQPTPSDDALTQLLDADIVYISHNHPDHMHEESLLYLYENRPEIPIFIPNFKSKSTEIPLRNIGFKNIITLEFNQIFQVDEHQLYVSILKSGDFRDDSGLYISYGKKQALITVDSSALNHYHLPKDIDFLATSFAAGASGYPWCFDHYTESDKEDISAKRRLSVKQSISKYIDSCSPRTYMPYAGYFSESAPRDSYIKEKNKKNSPEEIKQLVKLDHPKVQFIDPTITDEVTITNLIEKKRSNSERLSSAPLTAIQERLEKEKVPNNDIFFRDLLAYFENCGFKDNLLLYVLPCFSDFTEFKRGLMIDFTNTNNITLLSSKELENLYLSNQAKQRQLLIKVRATLLWQVINQHKSWEELSIGFHCRIHRKPDVYNSDFWYHFSNIYIK